jgi:hypothetical protein
LPREGGRERPPLIDGYRYWQFVFFPSGDPNVAGDLYGASPYGLPVTLLPTTP